MKACRRPPLGTTTTRKEHCLASREGDRKLKLRAAESKQPRQAAYGWCIRNGSPHMLHSSRRN